MAASSAVPEVKVDPTKEKAMKENLLKFCRLLSEYESTETLNKIQEVIGNLKRLNLPAEVEGPPGDASSTMRLNSEIKHPLDSRVNGHVLLIYTINYFNKLPSATKRSFDSFYTNVINSLFEQGAGISLHLDDQEELLESARYLLIERCLQFQVRSFIERSHREQKAEVTKVINGSFLHKLLLKKGAISAEIVKKRMDRVLFEIENSPKYIQLTDVLFVNELLGIDPSIRLTQKAADALTMHQNSCDQLGLYACLKYQNYVAPAASTSSGSSSAGSDRGISLALELVNEVGQTILGLSKGSSSENKESEARLERALAALKGATVTPTPSPAPTLFAAPRR